MESLWLSEHTVLDLPTLVPPLRELCFHAGELICRHYGSPQASEYRAKGDDSPLTQADLDSHHLLEQGLRALGEDLPILSEESAEVDRETRRGWERFWLVDPLDGTREFLERTGEFTINVALVEQGRARLGMLYLPLARAAYVGIPGHLAHCHLRQEDGHWQTRSLRVRPLPDKHLTLLASRRHGGRRLQECLAWLEREWGPVSRRNSGSAFKFCQLVDGQGDFYPRFSPCCEWDTAAGQALLEAAGGALLDLGGRPLRYNTRDSLYSPNFYAIADPGHALWQGLIDAG